MAPGNDLQASIEHDVMCDSKVLETWSEIAYIIPPKYEAYSFELLQSVCHLWTTIRGFSFTEGCNILFKKSYHRGTRKTLIKRGTDKLTQTNNDSLLVQSCINSTIKYFVVSLVKVGSVLCMNHLFVLVVHSLCSVDDPPVAVVLATEN